MIRKKPAFPLVLIASLLANIVAIPFMSASPVVAATLPVIEDFETGLPAGKDANNNGIGFNTFQDPNGATTVAISISSTPPVALPGAPANNNVLKMALNVISYAGFTHSFENAALNTWVSQDWSAYEGLSFWLYGNNSGTTLFVDVLDNRNPGSTKDDAERWSIDLPDNFSGWREVKIPFTSMHRKDIGNGAPNDGFGLTEVHGWALGAITTPSAQTYYFDNATLYGVAPVRPLTIGFDSINYAAVKGAPATLTVKLSKPSATAVTVQYATTFGQAIPNRDYIPVAGMLTFAPNVTTQSFTVVTIDNHKYQGDRGVLVALSNPTGGAALGVPAIARVNIQENRAYDPSLLDDFEATPYLWSGDDRAKLTSLEIAAGSPEALPGQGAYERVLQVSQKNGKGGYEFGRDFAIGQDWSDSAGLSFWYYGRNNGRAVDVNLANTDATSPEAAKRKLVWSDEFDKKAGSAPNPNVWDQEVGDGTVNGIPGWGNDELEYYTGGTANVAADGQGHLQITTKQADGSLMCYYGPCKYTSARLLTKNRFEVAYGRVEARVKIGQGAGLWPAFWMLGTDIDQVNWPQAGEIDIMENVGRLPNQVFGTLHGPGYAGGQSYGRSLDLGKPVADDYHVFAVDWQPNQIIWSIDGTRYFTATAADAFLQGKQWVFNHPFYMLLNVAVGGNFGGAVGPATTFPQTTTVDYVRLYQVKPKLASFSASFNDDFSGWKQVSIPFASFKGKKGSMLDLTSVQNLSFDVDAGVSSPVLLDQIRLNCSSEITVTSTADSGAGSLRKSLGSVCVDGTVHFLPVLAGQTIKLTSGPLSPGKNVTVDGSAASGVTISGNHADRAFIITAGTSVTLSHLTIADGYGWQLAGGILNNGKLTLDQSTVKNSVVATSAQDWWQGGGGIYVGDGATLNLMNSTISDNTAGPTNGGGLYGFLNSTISIVNSTISTNTAGNVGGGFRSLGNVSIVNSTFSGNASMGWMGGAFFHTDGVMHVVNSTIANNTAPAGTTGGMFVGTFTAGSPTLTLVNTLVSGNSGTQCFYAPYGAGTVTATSLGHNLVVDGTCFAVPSDVIVGNAMIDPLANNGGSTQTHALQAGSPAIDAADDTACPAADQRGVARPRGLHCDIGSFER